MSAEHRNSQKELTPKELEKVHQQFRHVPHINTINIYGRVDQPPQFWYAGSKYLPSERKVPFFRTILEVETKLKKGNPADTPYFSHVPVFCWHNQAENAKKTIKNVGEFVHVTGRIQNRKVFKDIDLTSAHLQELMAILQIRDPKHHWVAEKALEILGFKPATGDKDGVFFVKSHSTESREVSARTISKGIGEHYTNEVLLQGLVSSPPSIRPLEGGSYCLSFKVSVNRDDNVSARFKAQLGALQTERDIIDVVKMGPDVADLLPEIRHGYPIYVKGRLESGLRQENIRPSREQMDKLQKHLPGMAPKVLDEILVLLRYKSLDTVRTNVLSWVNHEVFALDIKTDGFKPAEDEETAKIEVVTEASEG